MDADMKNKELVTELACPYGVGLRRKLLKRFLS